MDERSSETVDVGVVTWNTRDLTVRALRRLADGDQGCPIRLLVHDNASTDGTADAIRAEVPEAEVVAGTENLGFAGGVNALIARSTSPWFVTLNSDAWPEPGCLGRLRDVAVAHPRAAIVAARLERPDGRLEHSTHPFPGLAVALATAAARPEHLPQAWARRHWLHGAWQHDEERIVDWAVGAALLLRRSAIDEIGAFDDSLFMYAEDLELCWRAHRHGWETWFAPDAVVRHIGNASGAQAWGTKRDLVIWANSYEVARRYQGRARVAAYRYLNAAGAAASWLRAGRPAGRDGLRDRLAPHLPRLGMVAPDRPATPATERP